MPELPEVETIARDLRQELVGSEFRSIVTTHDKSVIPGVDEFTVIRDQRVQRVDRRGKFLLLFFDNDYVVTIHLRMSGRILLRPHHEDALRFERHRLDFDRTSLRFCDSRKFGRLWISHIDNYEQETGIWKLGIEPFSKGFDSQYFKNLVKGKRGTVKKILLDQSLVAGIGNIYADEACFYSKVRPDARIEEIDEAKLEDLYAAILKALNQGIRKRGTSISDFQDAYGKMGSNQELLYVYGRGGQPCMECKSPLVRTKVAGRGTVYCESCQG